MADNESVYAVLARWRKGQHHAFGATSGLSRGSVASRTCAGRQGGAAVGSRPTLRFAQLVECSKGACQTTSRAYMTEPIQRQRRTKAPAVCPGRLEPWPIFGLWLGMEVCQCSWRCPAGGRRQPGIILPCAFGCQGALSARDCAKCPGRLALSSGHSSPAVMRSLRK